MTIHTFIIGIMIQRRRLCLMRFNQFQFLNFRATFYKDVNADLIDGVEIALAR